MVTGVRRGAAVAGLILGVVAAAAVTLWLRGDPGTDRPTPSPGAGRSSAPTAPPGPSPTTDRAVGDPMDLLASPDAAAEAGGEAVLAAGRSAAAGPWADLGHPRWPAEEARPVYVVEASVDRDSGRVTADVVIASRFAPGTEEVLLRLLPAADALGPAEPEVAVTVDRRRAETSLDTDGARLSVTLPQPATGDGAALLRIDLTYLVPTIEDIIDDGGPAGFGLLARSPAVITLGHWLPLLTLPGEDGPMLSWGDVGGFPAAVWSVKIHGGGTVVTGGEEAPCPAEPTGCVWARGVALRDVSAVVYDDVHEMDAEAGGVEVRVVAPPDRGLEGVLGEVATATEIFTERLAPLAWRQVDTVAVPLGPGAAGMEFPGLSMIDDDAWDGTDGGFGTFVIVHEVAHQWFHALVGSGSLSSPVVDESLAQYLTVVYWREVHGVQAAEDFSDRRLLGRYRGALEDGLTPEPPAQPLGDFDGASAYGALVYGRAPLGWLAAEDAVGVDTLQRFLRELVARYGLGVVGDDTVLDEAAVFDPALGEALRRWWTSSEALVETG